MPHPALHSGQLLASFHTKEVEIKTTQKHKISFLLVVLQPTHNSFLTRYTKSLRDKLMMSTIPKHIQVK